MKKERIQSIGRCFDIIEYIAKCNTPPTINDIVEQTQINKTTVYNILSTLLGRGYVAHSSANRYSIGEKFSDIWFPSVGKGLYSLRVEPLMTELYGVLEEETCYLAYFKDYCYYAMTQRISKKALSCGPLADCADMHATSLGKVYLASKSNDEIVEWAERYGLPKLLDNTIDNIDRLLAEIEQVRSQGYGENNEENTEGCYSISVPVRGTPYMGLSFTIPTIRYKAERLPHWIAVLKQYSAAIEHCLGHG